MASDALDDGGGTGVDGAVGGDVSSIFALAVGAAYADPLDAPLGREDRARLLAHLVGELDARRLLALGVGELLLGLSDDGLDVVGEEDAALGDGGVLGGARGGSPALGSLRSPADGRAAGTNGRAGGLAPRADAVGRDHASPVDVLALRGVDVHRADGWGGARSERGGLSTILSRSNKGKRPAPRGGASRARSSTRWRSRGSPFDRPRVAMCCALRTFAMCRAMRRSRTCRVSLVASRCDTPRAHPAISVTSSAGGEDSKILFGREKWVSGTEESRRRYLSNTNNGIPISV